MEKIASKDDPKIPNDKHFIPIDMNNLNDVIDNMIAEGTSYSLWATQNQTKFPTKVPQ